MLQIAVIKFGPQGAAGPKGDKGDPGTDGADGSDASVTQPNMEEALNDPDSFRVVLGATDTGSSLFQSADGAEARDVIAPFPGLFDNDAQALDAGVAVNQPYRRTDGQIAWVRGGTDPLVIAGLTAAFDFGDASTLFSDAGVTLAADGATVQRITDAAGGALYLEQATAAKRWARNGSTLTPPAAPIGFDISGAGLPFNWRAGTVVLIHGKRRAHTQSLGTAVIMLDATYGAWASYGGVRAHAGGSGQRYVGGLYDDPLNIWAASFGAASSLFVSNEGSRTDIVWPNTGSINYGSILARTTDDFGPWGTPIRAIYFYARALTLTEIEAIRAWHGIASTQVVVQAIGDSLTQGYSAVSIGSAWPNRIVADREWSLINSGLASHRASTAATDTAWRVPMYEAGKTNVATIWLGTNDMQLSSAAPATVWANLQTVCNAFKAAHPDWQIILGTIIPRTDGVFTPPVGYPPGTTFDDVRDELNGLIRAGYAAIADGIADLAANADIGADGASNSTAYFNADKVHLNDAGHGVAAGIWQAAIDSLL